MRSSLAWSVIVSPGQTDIVSVSKNRRKKEKKDGWMDNVCVRAPVNFSFLFKAKQRGKDKTKKQCGQKPHGYQTSSISLSGKSKTSF